MIVTLTGANAYDRGRALDKLVADFAAAYGDFGLERVDGEEADVARLRESVQSMPFLSPRKLVVLQVPGKQKAWAENIEAILDEVTDSTDVILHEPKLDKRLTYYKTLKKKTDFRDYPELDANGLARWAGEYAAGQGGSLSSADARLLLDRLGTNQQLMQQELDKLLTYDPAITKATIELLTDPMPQSTVFELLDAAFAGRTQRAMDLYREQRALKVEPQAILALLAWQLHVLAVMKAAGPRSVDDIARTARLNPFVVRKSQGLTRQLTLAQLKNLIANLLRIDVQSKTISIDLDEALQLYLMRLQNPHPEGP